MIKTVMTLMDMIKMDMIKTAIQKMIIGNNKFWQ
jgi:hypothetical protein